MKLPLALLLIFTAFSITSCMNNEEDLTAPIEIEPTNVSYADDIQPILDNSCTSCHGAGAQSGVDLRNHNAVINSVGNQYGELIVSRFAPDNSPLVDKIEPNPQEGNRMPSNSSPLSPDDIALVRAWIEAGAENN